MKHPKPRAAASVAVLVATLVVAGGAFAQAWPSKPIRVIVPAVPGSAVDVGMRRIAPKLTESLGQPVVVENRPGANSAIGAREVARAPADGYTLLHANINNAFNDLLAPDPCCRLNQELIAVTRIFASPMVMVVNPAVPATTLKEYLELARAKPQGVTYASGGTGSLTQLVGETLKAMNRVNIAEVPYKSIGAEMPDLVAGHVMTGFLAPSVVVQNVKAGKLRALAVADKARLALLPDVPTMAEAGVPIEATGWNGIYAPAGTPEAIRKRLQDEIAKALAAPDITADARTNGWVLGGESPEAFSAYVRGELDKWGKVIREAGIKLQ